MFIGGLVYVLWRPDTLIMFSWATSFGLDYIIEQVRGSVAPFYQILPKWFTLSLPQALWFLSGSLAVHSIWRDSWSENEQLWLTVIAFLAFGGELGQAVGIVQGSFDFVDLVFMIAAYFFGQAIGFADTKLMTKERSNS
jgi:hypothetical protein